MFGNAPKAVWSRWCETDELNRIDLACRCVLIREPQGRTILLEAGVGAFFEPKLRDRYGVQESEHRLLQGLAEQGVQPTDVDIIVLSHLHFDHAGGILNAWQPDAPLSLAFPNAHYVVSRPAWDRATHPHPRDRASYIPELPGLVKATGRLELIERDHDRSEVLGDNYRFTFSDGHTPGQLLTTVQTPHGSLMFMGDLIPGAPWVHLPITMGYDRYPELLIDEKRAVLETIAQNNTTMMFVHDAKIAAAKLGKDERGRYRAIEPVETLCWE